METFGLQYVPPEIGELRYLEHLSLSDNKINCVSALVGNLTNLTTLFLSQVLFLHWSWKKLN